MPYVELPRVRLRFTDTGTGTGSGTDAGAGTPLLLIHGWGGDSAEWRPVVAALPPGRRVITADLRGHGESSTPPRGYSPADFAGDLAMLMSWLDLPPVIAVGHSMGAQIVVALTAARSDAVMGLVALDPAYGADDAELRRIPGEQEQLRAEGSGWAARFVDGAHTSATPRRVRARHRRLMSAMDPRVLAEARDAMYLAPGAFGPRAAAEAMLVTLRRPVLTVMTSLDRAAWARRALPDPRSRVEVFEGCGHYLHEERPEELASLLARWLVDLEVSPEP
ncbi:alpha/beta fold hydrolase [Streptomyces scopuliridis]|uniref:alpha/beta fold hydrolase n=1 Tax=Streptomyces scopuliridis TaxID=452529 RepID=UPI0004C20BCB|nr:alpha/beta hydrolase [Streptomyces scopuliridis]